MIPFSDTVLWHSWHRLFASAVSAWLLVNSAAQAKCDTSTQPEPATSRFLINGDMVHDKMTNLTWMRCSQGQHWIEEKGWCAGFPQTFTFKEANAGWTNGWRMPTKDELLTIVAGHCASPAIDDNVFPNTSNGRYWTSTPDRFRCWFVDFTDGRADWDDITCDLTSGNRGAVRLVRVRRWRP